MSCYEIKQKYLSAAPFFIKQGFCNRRCIKVCKNWLGHKECNIVPNSMAKAKIIHDKNPNPFCTMGLEKGKYMKSRDK
jgi:hypothetical protein